MRVRLSDSVQVYPDVTVTCDERDDENAEDDEIAYPRLVVEVLSPYTERTDRGRKLRDYLSCPSIEEYVLVNSEYQAVEVYRRGGRNWTYHRFESGDEVELAGIGAPIPIAAFYERTRDAAIQVRMLSEQGVQSGAKIGGPTGVEDSQAGRQPAGLAEYPAVVARDGQEVEQEGVLVACTSMIERFELDFDRRSRRSPGLEFGALGGHATAWFLARDACFLQHENACTAFGKHVGSARSGRAGTDHDCVVTARIVNDTQF